MSKIQLAYIDNANNCLVMYWDVQTPLGKVPQVSVKMLDKTKPVNTLNIMGTFEKMLLEASAKNG